MSLRSIWAVYHIATVCADKINLDYTDGTSAVNSLLTFKQHCLSLLQIAILMGLADPATGIVQII
jgi:hypothetical protein